MKCSISLIGPSRHFAGTQQFDPFRSEADSNEPQ